MEKRGIETDAHGFDGFIGSLSSVFNPGTGIQINVAGFTLTSGDAIFG
ncbi:MAG: hypothetical protein SCH39_02390 [Methanosarcinales archaeon]|nr:hypothetical protein [Methanosarcinales archaeon]